jgi:hypothetical protein
MTTIHTTRSGTARTALRAVHVQAPGRLGVVTGAVAAVAMAFALVVGSAASVGDGGLGGDGGSQASSLLARTGAELLVVGELARGALGHPFP